MIQFFTRIRMAVRSALSAFRYSWRVVGEINYDREMHFDVHVSQPGVYRFTTPLSWPVMAPVDDSPSPPPGGVWGYPGPRTDDDPQKKC